MNTAYSEELYSHLLFLC